MTTNRTLVTLSLLLFLLTHAGAPAGEPLKSSLQPGEKIPSAFHPLNVNGKFAGETHCLVCENGLSPVAMIFAREVSAPLIRLLTKLDAATAKNRDLEMGSFVVFLGNKDGLEKQLKDVAAKQSLKHLILSIEDPANLEDYKVARDADVTVVLYHQHAVRANHAFRKGKLTDLGIEKILGDLPKILDKSKSP